MKTVQTLKPDLAQSRVLSPWQQVVNQAGYAATKADIRSTLSQHEPYIHTGSKTILGATVATHAKLNNGTVQVQNQTQTQAQLKRDFLLHYGDTLDVLMQEIPRRFLDRLDVSVDEFKNQSLNEFEQIADALFTDVNEGKNEPVRDRVLQASISAEKRLMDLRATFSDGLDKAPQFFLHDGKVTVVRHAAPPENLALRGGGAKGIGYIGVLRAMESQGLIKPLRHIAGTSAGALTASLVAGGLSAEKFADISRAKSPLEMAWDSDTEAKQVLKLGIPVIQGMLSATYVVKMIDGAIKASIGEFLASEPPPDLSSLEPGARETLHHLANADLTQPVTFNHLRLLHRVAPERFKELSLTVFDKTDNTTRHINADTYPDWAVGETARMSMAIPGLFKSVKGADGHMYADGGLGSNMPSEVFVRPNPHAVPEELTKGSAGTSRWTEAMDKHLNGLVRDVGKPAISDAADVVEAAQDDKKDDAVDSVNAMASAKTLVIAFDETGKFNKVVYGGDLFSKTSAARKLFGANEAAATSDRLKTYAAGPNAMVAYHGTLKTQSFFASSRQLDLVEQFAQAKALEQIRQQRPIDLAVHEAKDSLAEALQSLSSDELTLARLACQDRIANGRASPDLIEGQRFAEVPDQDLLRALNDEEMLREKPEPLVQASLDVRRSNDLGALIQPSQMNESEIQHPRASSKLVVPVAQTMPRLISEADPIILDPKDARIKADKGLEAAERSGVSKTSSGGFFKRAALVLGALLGMGGTVALCVLFPPFAPLVFTGYLLAFAGVGVAVTGGPQMNADAEAQEDSQAPAPVTSMTFVPGSAPASEQEEDELLRVTRASEKLRQSLLESQDKHLNDMLLEGHRLQGQVQSFV